MNCGGQRNPSTFFCSHFLHCRHHHKVSTTDLVSASIMSFHRVVGIVQWFMFHCFPANMPGLAHQIPMFVTSRNGSVQQSKFYMGGWYMCDVLTVKCTACANCLPWVVTLLIPSNITMHVYLAFQIVCCHSVKLFMS